MADSVVPAIVRLGLINRVRSEQALLLAGKCFVIRHRIIVLPTALYTVADHATLTFDSLAIYSCVASSDIYMIRLKTRMVSLCDASQFKTVGSEALVKLIREYMAAAATK
jgi:hypothetical protein